MTKPAKPAPNPATPETPEEDLETPETPETPNPEAVADKEELDNLRKENERLKNQTPQAQPAAQPKLSPVTQLESFNEDQWAALESRTNKTRDVILREAKDWDITQRQNALEARTAVADAINDEVEKNPKLIRLRSSIKEFMSEIPVEDQIDPARRNRALEKAVIYAKGKHISMTPETPSPKSKPGTGTPAPGAPEIEEEEDGGTVEGEVKDDTYINPTTGQKIVTGKRLDKKDWKKIQNPDEPNSVRIPGDFDKKPTFH